jgi:SAM-dependent methyltransferase
MKTDRAWEIWGSRQPYFAVLTDDRYQAGNLGVADREEFFRSGAHHVAWVLAQWGDELDRSRALDFGCGVGRLLIPLAAEFQFATGVDVSPSMRAEAGRNCAAFAIHNVTLQDTSEMLAAHQHYDLVHSVLVFQHIRSRAAQRLLRELATRVAPGGALAVQLMFRPFGARRALSWLKNRIPFGYALALRWRGRQATVAPMEMNPANLNRVMALLQDHGFDEVRLVLSQSGGIGSAFLLGRRTGSR